MADSLLRLANSVDQAVPPLIALALSRKLAFAAFGPLRRAAGRRLAQRPLARMLHSAFSKGAKALLAAASAFFALDALDNKIEVASCGVHTAPRPLAIAAAIALVCFFTTSHLSTSMLCIVVLDCVKRRSVLTGAAATACVAVWADVSARNLVLLAASAFAGEHFVRCGQPAGAALAFASAWLLASRWLSCPRKHYL